MSSNSGASTVWLSICPKLTFSVAPHGDSTEEEGSLQIEKQLEKERKRFRSVLRLNILLSTINGFGHPTLRWKASIPPKEQKPKPDYALLKYVTSILVRNSEIIAAMAHKPSPSPSSGPFSEPALYQVNIMRTEQPSSSLQQGELAFRTCQNDQGDALASAFTTVANPYTAQDSDKDPYFEKVLPSINCLVVTGESHWRRTKLRGPHF